MPINPFHVYMRCEDIPVDEEFEIVLQLMRTKIDGDGIAQDRLWAHSIKGKLERQPGEAGIPPVVELGAPLCHIHPKTNQITPIVVPAFDRYELQALCNGELCGAILIPVIEAGQPNGDVL